MAQEKPIKKKSRVPHTYVVLFLVVIVVALASYIIPAGQFDRVKDEHTGRNVVDPQSFRQVDSNPTTFFRLFTSVPKGMKEAQAIIFFIFIVGGSFQIITATGAIDAGIGRIIKKIQGQEKIIIPVFLALFSLGGATFGMAEEAIVFVPIGIALARALGFDAIVGMAMVTLGAACGFTSGAMNPFTVGVAQGIAELPLFSGLVFRIVLLIIMLAVTSLFLLRYAHKVQQDPTQSVVYELELAEKDKAINLDHLPEFKTQHLLVLLTVAVGLIAIIIGVFKAGWYITEIAATFLIMGIIGGFLGKFGPSKIAEKFVEGARGITFGALVVGIARTILVVMEDAFIIDSIINGLAGMIQTLPGAISALGMYVVQVVINFFVPSGSGQAAATMPIMAPLSDVIGLNRQVAVLAYQLGDGFTNSIIPTSGVLMASLSIANINYDQWTRFLWPLMSLWLGIGAVAMLIATAINYGPF